VSVPSVEDGHPRHDRPLKRTRRPTDCSEVKVGGQSLSRPYLVGLVAATVGGALTSAALFASSTLEARAQASQHQVQRTIDSLPLPPSLEATAADADCRQVNIDRCLFSTATPPDTLKDVKALMAGKGTVHSASCGAYVAARAEVARCNLDTTMDGVPVRVLLWPHISSAGGLKFVGTDVWIDIRTDSDI
jgi:hypothetical protein